MTRQPLTTTTTTSPTEAPTMTTTTCTLGDRIAHDTSLDNVAGYEVRQTIVDGETLGYAGPVVATFDRPASYGDALAHAYTLRDLPRSYALVEAVFTCGCNEKDLFA